MGTTIIGRRDFLKKSVTIGTALTLPSIMTKGNKLSGTDHTELVKSTDASGKQTFILSHHRILDTGTAAFKVSSLGFGVMGLKHHRGEHPMQHIRLVDYQ